MRSYFRQDLRFAFKVAGIYLALSVLWILFSDRILSMMASDIAEFQRWQTSKGLFFVTMSALTVAFLVYRGARDYSVLMRDLDRRVAERTADLEIARRKAEETDRLKSVFLSTMSHELRTPLNSIIGFSSVLLADMAGPLNDEQRRQLNMVHDSGRHLLSLINDVLDLSRIEAGKVDIVFEPFNARAAALEAAEMLRERAENKGLAFRVHVGEGVGVVDGDRRRFKQILINLLGNAVKFTQAGEVELRVEGGAESLEASVRDTGVGIRPEDRSQLFQPFANIRSESTESPDGTGLGLSIVKKLLDRMGGSIEVRSEPGVGSLFTFTLPRHSVVESSFEKRTDH